MATFSSPLTHFDAQGQAHMVDVSAKAATHRIAVAQGRIVMKPATLALILAGNAKKGDVLGVARIAAIQEELGISPVGKPAQGGRVAQRIGFKAGASLGKQFLRVVLRGRQHGRDEAAEIDHRAALLHPLGLGADVERHAGALAGKG